MNKREAVVRAGANHESKDHGPSAEEIAVRAYEIFVGRGASHGNDLDDWLQAERELIEKNGRSTLRSSAAAA